MLFLFRIIKVYQVELQLELETAKNLVGSTANKISEASDSGEKANLQMELVEAQLDLDWKEKEFKADQLKHELHEMEVGYSYTVFNLL